MYKYLMTATWELLCNYIQTPVGVPTNTNHI